jgi:hypothetical protein
MTLSASVSNGACELWRVDIARTVLNIPVERSVMIVVDSNIFSGKTWNTVTCVGNRRYW